MGRALQPAPGPLAFGAASRTLVVAGAVAVAGAVFGDLDAVGLIYFATACAVAFARADTYRGVFSALLAQAAGAVTGLGVAASAPEMPTALVIAAAAAAFVSGWVGPLGPSAPAFGMMLSIGLAFGQFSGSPLPWWSQILWYLTGTAAVAVVWLLPLWLRRQAREREIAAAVLESAADVCEAIGSSTSEQARSRLAAASATARTASRNSRAERVAFAAAALYSHRQPVPRPVVIAIRAAAQQTRSGMPFAVAVDFDTSTPGLEALADALSPRPTEPPAPPNEPIIRRAAAAVRALVSTDALLAGVRLGLCLAVATAATIALHGESHSFWLPLTVAVVVRPEYASIFVRTVNRVCGSIVGACCAGAVLAVVASGAGVALAAAVALAFAVLTAPKLYALSVIGVTASALLSSNIGSPDHVLPLLRVLDTVVGAAIAVIVGFLIWPHARRFSGTDRLRQAVDAARAYLEDAADGASPSIQRTRDDAYRMVHQLRDNTERSLSEPPPVNRAAEQLFPRTLELERLVDDITELAFARDSGSLVDVDAELIEERLRALAHP